MMWSFIDPLLAQGDGGDGEVSLTNIAIIAGISIIVIILIVFLVFFFRYIGLWIRAFFTDRKSVV